MKTTLLIILCTFALGGCSTSKKLNEIKMDERTNSEILYGYTTLDAFQKEPFSLWYTSEYAQYEPDEAVIGKIKEHGLKKIKIVLVMGTWCGDSKREVPRFMKILESMGYKLSDIEIINIDRSRKAEGTSLERYGVGKIPTFIFYKKDAELGRIIETPKQSIEKDILEIIGG
jgi:thiol-disulfide isomerase/thioredoxin